MLVNRMPGYVTVWTPKIRNVAFTLEKNDIDLGAGSPSPFVRSSIDPSLPVPPALVVSKQFSLWQEGFCMAAINISPLRSHP